jgi:phenylalanyl-tRNA synthetase beta subunit
MKNFISSSFKSLLVLLVAATALLSCQKDLDETLVDNINQIPNLTTKINSSVSGFVVDENNQAVAGASVVVYDKTTTTDDYGYFSVKNVNVKAKTPEWMEQALARSGIRTHSILVDVTNYVLLELGQPMHAFDLAKIEGTIQVRQAQPQEKLVLLNDQEVELQEDIMVIADQQKVLAIA